MKIGDLVTDGFGTYGIITAQIGVVDRWWVHWFNANPCAVNGFNVEVI